MGHMSIATNRWRIVSWPAGIAITIIIVIAIQTVFEIVSIEYYFALFPLTPTGCGLLLVYIQ